MDVRGFKDAGEMNTYMVEKWNRKVKKHDEVVILGDFSWGGPKETNELLEILNGKLYLITGNHDDRMLKRRDFNRTRFKWIKPYAELQDNKRKIILCHYPIMCYNGQYNRGKETYMLYGHVHNTDDQYLIEQFQAITRNTIHEEKDGIKRNIPSNMINCFCMYSDYTPLTLDEWIQCDRERKEIKNRRKRNGE